MTLVNISRQLSKAVSPLKFSPPITHVYNPLEYAQVSHEAYLKKFGHGSKKIIFVGMNPGPFGMAQTGIPFGEIAAVRDWMGISLPVKKPKNENLKRPIEGFDCSKSEVSGRRLWGWAHERFGLAENFFKTCFVVNYCPLVFMEQSGKNFTPDKLITQEKEKLFKACDVALRSVAEELVPEWIIGVGAFAETRAQVACEGLSIKIGRILHPSPASPLANRGWATHIERELKEMGIKFPKQNV